MTGAAPRRQRSLNERLRRLLVMLPWLSERGSVRTAEMAEHFGLSVAELIADLELAAMCGLPPYLDEMIDLVVDEDEVKIGVPRLFTQPLRLTAPEGFALVAAARAAMALPGADAQGPLARAIDKVGAALGADVGRVIEVDLGLAGEAGPGGQEGSGGEGEQGERLSRLRDAVADGAVLKLRYWAASTDEVTDRVVEPRDVFSDRGNWYLRADDRRAKAERTFRVDRIEDDERFGEQVATRPPGAIPSWFEGSPDVEMVRLRVSRAAAWVAERYPVSVTEDAGGDSIEITLPVVSERWLARLLLRLGPDAEVLVPQHWRRLGPRTAEAVLARYRGDTSSS